MAKPILEFIITPHAAFEMKRRGISEAMLLRVLASPEEREAVRQGRDLLQSRVDSEGKTYLIRVIVEVNKNPAEVVTVYRTSKLSKYWRGES